MKGIWKILFWVNWVIIFGFWWNGSGELLKAGEITGFLVAFGRLAGLVAAYMILLQFFFMGRTSYLERVFGLDKLSQVHHKNGRWGIIFLLIHPILLALGYKSFTNSDFWEQLWLMISGSDEMWLAAGGLFLFIIVVISSLIIVQKRFKYESWYFVHLVAYLAVFGSFWHQIAIGTDILASKIFYGYWIALYIFVFANHLVFRFFRPVYLYFNHRFFAERVVRENYNTVSIYIGGRNLEKFKIHSGQFMIFRFLKKGYWLQAHPFSLSMMPDGKNLRITVKNVGDFTSRIQEIAVGTKILIDGPYGVFMDLFGISNKVLFIAGGIGITPVRSLMEEMVQRGRDVVLLYSNRSEKDIVFGHEIQEVIDGRAKVVNVISDEPEFKGERGRLDEEKIRRLTPDVAEREIYLCGPPPMMEAIIQILKSLGVPERRIHFEKFSMG